MPVPNAFGARASLGPGLPDLYRCPRSPARASRWGSISAGRRSPSRSCSRTPCATPAAASSPRPTSRPSRPGGPAAPARPRCRSCRRRVLLQDFTGVPAVVDLAAMRDAMAALGGDPGARQPAGPGRPRDRPLGPGRRLGRRRRVRVQRGARVRAQRRALPAPPLGADGVPRPAGRAARDRHRPPGQPRVPRLGRDRPRRRWRPGRVPRHARRHGLAHDDGQRPRRPRLRRRRDRGRGRAARPAALPADAADRRRAAPRRAARGGDRDRPRAGRSPRCSARSASSARSSSSPATASPGCRSPTGRRSPT